MQGGKGFFQKKSIFNLLVLFPNFDRSPYYGSEGWEFESLRARHIINGLHDFSENASTYGKQEGSSKKIT